MSKKEPDFNIDNYNIEELLTIFGIEEPTEKENIMEVAATAIEKYRKSGHNKYVEFFSKGMNKLLSNYQLVEGILGKTDQLLDDIKEAKEQVGQMGEDLAEKFEEAKTQAQDFINPPLQEAGPNILKNRYYDGNNLQTRLGPGVVMPDRANYTSVPNIGLGAHAPQLQNRLFLPNAYAQIPFAQGYRNPTLQNAFLTWINIDSQYRPILPTGTSSASCPTALYGATDSETRTRFDASNNIIRQESSTDFCLTLASPITNVLAMTVGSIEVPMAGYYTFSDKYGNTSFEFKNGKADDDTIPWECLKIPEGNYGPTGIKNMVDNILKNAVGAAGATGTAPQLFINSSNQKTYFAGAAGSTGPFSFRWFGSQKCGGCANCTPIDAYDAAAKVAKVSGDEVVTKKEYACSHNNTGKKINSTFGWQMGFRSATSESANTNLLVNPVADDAFNTFVGATAAHNTIISPCIWNELGTKYMILEVDDFNRNRNSGNMGTMSMPMCTENFKLPKYAKEISQVYPICDPSDNIQRYPDPGNTTNDKQENLKFSSDKLNDVFDIGPVGEKEVTAEAYMKAGKGYYEKFNRACRKGTPAKPIAIKGEDTLTKAQKYTAREIRGTQKSSCINQYYAPQASNMLFRFPIQRLSENLQAPIVTAGPGMESGRRYFGPVTIEKLRVRLLDDKGFVIDLNCGEISFSLILERLYQY